MAKVKIKTRKERMLEYISKYQSIPCNKVDIFEHLINTLNINEKQLKDILEEKDDIENRMKYKTISIVFYEIPLPYMRGRHTRKSKVVYTPLARENMQHMKDYIQNNISDFKKIVTPMSIEIRYYLPTPSGFSKKDKVLAELGTIRPISTPDFDNVAKGYCDMSNNILWYDDALIRDGKSSKYYSMKPRVEFDITYQNIYESDKQLKSLVNSEKFKAQYTEDDMYIEVMLDVKNGEYYKDNTNNKKWEEE